MFHGTWSQEFSLLGVDFSINLNSIPKINFEKVLLKAKSELNSWKYRPLSPIGRIVVLKTLILPKFIHLFSSIPTPSSILDQINSIFYNFLWSGKPDKVNRTTVCMNYTRGGLKMMNVYMFEKQLKLKWLKYIIFQEGQAWYDLLPDAITDNSNIYIYGGQWLLNFHKELNPFWLQVATYWSELCALQPIKTNEDICNSSIWFNKQLSARYNFHLNWSRKGINFISDIIDDNGNVLSHENLRERYQINVNFLHYYSIQRIVKAFIEKHKNENYFATVKPCIPCHLKTLVKTIRNKRAIYEALCCASQKMPVCESKWNAKLSTELTAKNWQKLHSACFYTVQDNTYIWFQYRIIQRILGTNCYLQKIKISNTDLCRICGTQSETLVHLFSECNKVCELWLNIKNWIESKLRITLELNKNNYILGYYSCDLNFYPLNFILMIVRYYIFKCAMKGRDLNIYQAQLNVKEKFLEQQSLSILSKTNTFDEKWSIWQSIFEGI